MIGLVLSLFTSFSIDMSQRQRAFMLDMMGIYQYNVFFKIAMTCYSITVTLLQVSNIAYRNEINE